MSHQTVLVTGGNGYLGSFALAHLIRQGYNVRTTVRSLDKVEAVRKLVENAGVSSREIAFYETNLLSSEGWAQATNGVDLVLHVASPIYTLGCRLTEQEFIDAAKEGTLHVLRAAQASKVKRVVLVSSAVAIWSGKPPGTGYTEEDWTNTSDEGVDAYAKSKTIAERAAWDLVESMADPPELVTVQPSFVMGPVLGATYAESVDAARGLLTGKFPAMINLKFQIVDVRDLAAFFETALIHPKAAGQRIILASEERARAINEIAAVLRENIPPQHAAKLPRMTIPDFLIRTVGSWLPVIYRASPLVGHAWVMNTAKARTEFGWNPRPVEETILSTVSDLIS